MSDLNHNTFLLNGVKLSSNNKNIKPSFDFKSGANVGVTWNYIQDSCEGPKSLFRGTVKLFSIVTKLIFLLCFRQQGVFEKHHPKLL